MTFRPTECEKCGSSTGDSAAICGACTEAFRDTLRTIIGEKRKTSSPFDTDARHGLATDLELAISRQTSTSSNRGGKSGERVPPLPVDLRAARAWTKLGNALGDSLAYVGSAIWRGDPVELAEDLLELVPTLRRHRGCLEHIERVERAVDDAYAALDRQRLEYVGPCTTRVGRQSETTCSGQLRALPGAEIVTCQDCGTGHHVATVRETFAKRAAEQLLTAHDVARALTAANGHAVAFGTVRQWILRGRLVEVGRSDAGRALYRVADAQALVDAARARRTD